MTVLDKLKKKFLFFDGAMGTMLQKSGLKTGELPEEFNILKPEVIYNIHREYLNAGANIITTNTFGANRLKLKNSAYTAEEIITAAVKTARQSTEGLKEKYVALDIGPIGTLLSPLGTLSFEDAYDIFKEQILSGVNAGADIILIETMTDIYEAKAAILAAKENSVLPIFCTMSFQSNGRTFTGTDAATFVAVAEGLGVDVLGVNCSLGPKELQATVDELLKYSSIPIMVQANAGLPKYQNNTTYYDIDPVEYSHEISIMAKKGVVIFGGCCGTTPEYIKSLTNALGGLNPLKIIKKHFTTTTSSSKTVFLGDEIKIIGERINPTGKKRVKEALRENNLDYVIREAIAQQDSGSEILDINVGLPDIDEKEMMVKAVTELQGVVSLPLQIDSSNSDVLDAAARIYNGKPIINSVNGKKESMEKIFPIVKKYGCLVVALTLNEDGIPTTSEKRLEIASTIIKSAESYGIPEENILIDPLVLTASADQAAVMETLKAIPLIKNRYNVKIVLGTSNVSFGLPNRKLLNTTYLAMALAYGLDAPITDSTNEALMDVIRSFKVLANQDKDSKDYIHAYGNVVTENAVINSDIDLKDIIIKGLKDEARKVSLQLLNQYSSIEIVNEFMIPALDIVGERYERQEIFLPQLIRSAETSKTVFEAIKEKALIEDSEMIVGNKILLATVKGDIHDIGKNIVKLILENYGYKIIDLGKDVSTERIIESVHKENISLVGLSALMTTTVKNMEYTITTLKNDFPYIKIMVGGAVLTPDYAHKIGADFYSKDARGAVDIAKIVFKDTGC
ncbi:homocysteine S-methyltransferase family protein [Sedimentibacter sp.]|uniref:homocysteine S-methyltransferase family protein n=1 Tax=Sedimentibacter sp. TaxID=1960295 RepID=UPI0028AD3D8C|nr:homocysteine S-methyltransferase family protein [Sedimentibacter sp.]